MTGSWLDIMRAHADTDPGAVAITEAGGRSIGRGALLGQVSIVMESLAARGFEPGDPVLFSVRPGIDALVLVLAVHGLGGVLLPLDPGVSDALFESRVRLLRPKWVLAESILLVRQQGLVARLLRAREVHLAPLGAVAGATFVRVGWHVPGSPAAIPFRVLLQPTAPSARRSGTPALDETAPAFIVCTSGTTSHPKAVVHSRRSLRAIVHAVSGQLALTSGDVMFARDLHLMLPALLAGAGVVVPRDRSFDARRVLATLARERVSHAFLVTRDCRLLLDECVASARRVPDCVRSLMIGAAPVRAGFLSRLQSVLPPHTTAWCVYGATEILPIAAVSLAEKVAYSGTGDLVGRILPGVAARIDEHGELWVSGARLFTGYAGEPAVTEHRTGDLGRFDDDRLVLLGRAKDMIIRGETNIYPALYEPLVEAIDGVRRAALLGDFDADLADERVILVVEPEPGVNEAALHARVSRAVREGPLRLDASAQPDRIVVQRLPEAGRSHKIDKVALRRLLGVTAPCA